MTPDPADGPADAEPPPRLFGPADLVTAARLPLAVAFPLVDDWRWRIGFVVAAGLSDLLDGIIARRLGPSRSGVVLDPIADKAFMLAAFLTLVAESAVGLLTIWEVLAVLLRDILATVGLLVTTVRGRPITLPARTLGKWVTVFQFLTLGTLALGWETARPLAWLTAVLAVLAVIDYWRVAHVRGVWEKHTARPPTTRV